MSRMSDGVLDDGEVSDMSEVGGTAEFNPSFLGSPSGAAAAIVPDGAKQAFLDTRDMPAFRWIDTRSVADTAALHMFRLRKLAEDLEQSTKRVEQKTALLSELSAHLKELKADYKMRKEELKKQGKTVSHASSSSIERAEQDSVDLAREAEAGNLSGSQLPQVIEEDIGDDYEQDYRFMVQFFSERLCSMREKENELDREITFISKKTEEYRNKNYDVCCVLQSPVERARMQPVQGLRDLIERQRPSLTREESDALGLRRRVFLGSAVAPAAAVASMPVPPINVERAAHFMGRNTGRASLFRTVADQRHGASAGANSAEAARNSSTSVFEL